MHSRKILITGFQRGGTTLTRLLFDRHPDVQRMFHEKRILRDLDGWLRRFDVSMDKPFGEKVPWASANGKEAISYGNRWLNTFKGDARIIQIIRHPVDSGLSNQRLKDTNKKTFWLPLNVAIKRATQSIPLVIDHFKSDVRYTSVVFEELVTDPQKELTRLYGFCDLKNDKQTVDMICGLDDLRYYDTIRADKAYVYKTVENLNCEIPDYNKILQRRQHNV